MIYTKPSSYATWTSKLPLHHINVTFYRNYLDNTPRIISPSFIDNHDQNNEIYMEALASLVSVYESHVKNTGKDISRKWEMIVSLNSTENLFAIISFRLTIKDQTKMVLNAQLLIELKQATLGTHEAKQMNV